MFQIYKSKMFWGAMVLVAAIIGFFTFMQIGPKNNIKLHQVPIALVNEDTGKNAEQIQNKLEDKFAGSNSQIKWVKVNHESNLKKGFDNKKYYAAFIIKKGFSDSIQTQTKLIATEVMQKKMAVVDNSSSTRSASPIVKQAKIEVKINQGMNASMSQALEKALPAMGNNIGAQISQKEQSILKKANISLTVDQMNVINSPIKVTTKNVNKIPSKSVSGMMPMLLTIFTWLGSLISSLLLWRTHNKQVNGQMTFKTISSQVLSGAVMSAVISPIIYFFIHTCFSVPVPTPATFIGLLFFNFLIFYFIQTCVLDLAGFKGWPLIIIVWFMAAGVLSYAPQMLPSLYRNWIYSWIPMRFSMDTLTNNLYFLNGSTSTFNSIIVLSVIGGVALLIMYITPLIHRKKS